MDRRGDDVGEVEELEGGLVRDDRLLWIETEPGSDDLLVRRGRESWQSIKPATYPLKVSPPSMVGQEVPGETAAPGLLGGKIARLLGRGLKELVVIGTGRLRHVTPTLKNIQGSCDMQGGASTASSISPFSDLGER